MKKVLALVLAVIMVCTMAMAVTLDGTVVTPTESAPTGYEGMTLKAVRPGSSILFEISDLFGTDYAKNSKGEFVPASNKVTVTYSKGGDLVASQGWVKDVNGTYYYVITLKDSTVTNDGKLDFAIEKIVAKATGYVANEYKPADGKKYIAINGTCLTLDVGYDTGVLQIAEEGYISVTDNELKENTIYTVKKAVKDEKDVTVGKADVSNGTHFKTLNLVATAGTTYTVKATADLAKVTEVLNKNNVAGDKVVASYYPVKAMGLQLEAVLENAKSTYNVYSVAADGTVTKVAATLDDGVLTFKTTVSTIVVVDGTLAASSTTGNTTPGTTTNPGTGANDVVGVAAALAVVALVSGAAISLKK